MMAAVMNLNPLPSGFDFRVRPLAIGVALLSAGMAPAPALAQAIDYGALEDLFQEPVTTSATGSPQRSTEVPADMEIISAEDIRRSGATDIPELLRQVQGVDVWRHSFAAVDATVRGYNRPYSQRLLVLINGRQVYKDYCGYTSWGALPVNLSEIRQIEVVKGPNAALFGFNAVGGVVNIITYSPLYDDHNNVTVRAGNHGYQEVSLTHTAQFGDVGGARISLGGYGADEFDTDAHPVDEPFRLDRSRRRHAAVDTLFQVSDRTQVGIEATTVRSDQTNLLPFYGLTQAKYDNQSLRVNLGADTDFGLIEATAYQNVTHVDMNNAFIGDTQIDNRITVARVQNLIKPASDHTFRMTGEFRRNVLYSLPFEGGKVSYDVWAAGGMWDWQITPRLTLNNAVRYDRLSSGRSGRLPDTWLYEQDDYDVTLNEVSWNSGLVFRATDNDTFRLLAGSGVQLPSMIEGSFMFLLDPNDYGITQMGNLAGGAGSPEVEPTRVTNVALTWDREIPQWDASLKTSVFHTRNKDLKSVPGIRPDTMVDQVPYVMFTNVGDSSASGFEVGLSRTTRNWIMEGSYAYLRVSDDLDDSVYGPDGSPVKAIDYEDSGSRHKINARLGYATGPWEFDLYGNYVSGYSLLESGGSPFEMREVEVPSYTLFSGRIGYQFTDNASLALSAQGFNTSSHRESAAPEVERRVQMTLSVDY